MWNQEITKKLQANTYGFNLTERRVLDALMNNLLKGNIINQTQTLLAAETGIRVQHFNKAMAKLYGHKFWARCPTEGKRHLIMLSPYMAWKGDAAWQDSGEKQFDEWRYLEDLKIEGRRKAKGDRKPD